MLKKCYFQGDTIGFTQQTLRYQTQFLIFINALEEFGSYTDRALNRYDSSTGNDVITSSRKT